MRQPVAPFVQFHAELEADYPSAFAASAHLLRRVVMGQRLYASSPSGRGARFAVAARALREAWRQAKDPGRLPRADVLVLDVPARADYFPLLTPVVEELERRGLDVVRLSPGVNWHHAATGALGAARERYARLRPHEERFARRWGVSGAARGELSVVLRCHSWDAALTTNALKAVGARAGLAIHTKLDPGVLTAFDEAGVPLLLMQHGVFSGAWDEHDFLGAAMLLAWGQYFADELAGYAGPKPPSRVVGSPRLEHLAGRRAKRSGGNVVFFGTNYAEDVDARALRLAAQALRGRPNVLFRPHPAEGGDKYRALVAEGLVAANQVVAERDSYELLLAAGLVLGSQSTLLLEAAAIGVPAAQLLPEDLPVAWAAQGLPHASRPDELAALTTAALGDARYAAGMVAAARPLARAMFSEPRGAARRAARAVEESALGRSGATEAVGA